MGKVTILMTTYNEKKAYLTQAIDSILAQTYQDFKFLIVIDNPDNAEALKVFDEYSKMYKRIEYVVNNENLGLPLALNRGIDLIETEYIARMDADDIALPNRIQMQLDFLLHHNNVGIVGANVIKMEENGIECGLAKMAPDNIEHIRQGAQYANLFNHPTLFGKTEIFKKYRYRNLRFAQDYDFTCRLLEDGIVLTNLKEYLLKYRLCERVTDNKRYSLSIIGETIQKYYKKGTLNEVDIEKIIQEELTKNSKETRMHELDYLDSIYSSGMTKQYIRFFVLCIGALFKSKLTRRFVKNHICSFLLRRRYQRTKTY